MYFAEQPEDQSTPEEANNLLKYFRFLDEGPSTTELLTAECRFKSHFLYELITTTHLSNITGYITIEGWDLSRYATGRNRAGVITIACAAVSLSFQLQSVLSTDTD